MNSNLQTYGFMKNDLVGKEDEPLYCEVFCVQSCEYGYLQEETWNVYEKNLQRRGVYATQGRGGKRGFASCRGKEIEEDVVEEYLIIPRVEDAHVECIDEENNNEKWERQSHSTVVLELNEEEEDVFTMCFMEEAQEGKEGIDDGYQEMKEVFACLMDEATPIDLESDSPLERNK